MATALALGVCGGGCASAVTIVLPEYQGIVRGAEDANVAVRLHVADARQTEFGGADPMAVGTFPGELFQRREMRVTDPNRAKSLVHVATKDALRLTRVGVSASAPRALVATVRAFWLDVHGRVPAAVQVDLVLEDESGTRLWERTVTGTSGGFILLDVPGPFITKIFQWALVDYAERAMAVFAARDFQRHLY
jgi:hypothetical protein